jgi:multidrug efflux pump subunit AcrA (membrane-fusion protein)
MRKITVVFYGYCERCSLFTSQGDAEKAAEQYGRAHGYACEAYECSLHTTRHGAPKMYFHIRPKTYPFMTREQWEQRAAELRLLAEQKAAEKRALAEQEAARIEALRLQRAAQQEAARAKAEERRRQLKQRAEGDVSTKRYNDGLTTRQRWIRDGKCPRCGKVRDREDRRYCTACLALFIVANRKRMRSRGPVPKEVWIANLRAASKAAWARRKAEGKEKSWQEY